MSKKAKRSLIVIALLLILAAGGIVGFNVWSYHRQEGIRFVKSLGSGINIGNSFDAHGASKHIENPTAADYETYWHNPQISEELISGIRKAGFRIVRIPVTWEDHMDENGRVDSLWMDRVETVVRRALANDLTVILNLHHESWLDLSNSVDEVKARYIALWKQIAKRFSDCGEEKLLFEGCNEPRLRDSEEEWTGGNTKLREQINELNRIFVDTVRATGGRNAERWLLIPTYCNSTDEKALEALTLPDRRCIVSLHVYINYDFCQNDDGTAEWDPNGKGAGKMAAAFDSIYAYFTQNCIPVIITECGCQDKNNEADRILWVQSLRKGAGRCFAPCVWWDNGDQYRVIDRETGKVTYERLVNEFIGE